MHTYNKAVQNINLNCNIIDIWPILRVRILTIFTIQVPRTLSNHIISGFVSMLTWISESCICFWTAFGQHCLNTDQMDKARKLYCQGTYTNMPSNLRSLIKLLIQGYFGTRRSKYNLLSCILGPHKGKKKPQIHIHMSVQAQNLLNNL